MDSQRVIIPLRGDNGCWHLCVRVDEEPETLYCSIACPLAVPVDRRAEMALFITRLNWCMILGAFEMDMEDGEVRAKVNIPLGVFPLSPPDFERIIGVLSGMMDRYLPGIVKVITGTPTQQAFELCASPGQDSRPPHGFWGRITHGDLPGCGPASNPGPN